MPPPCSRRSSPRHGCPSCAPPCSTCGTACAPSGRHIVEVDADDDRRDDLPEAVLAGDRGEVRVAGPGRGRPRGADAGPRSPAPTRPPVARRGARGRRWPSPRGPTRPGLVVRVERVRQADHRVEPLARHRLHEARQVAGDGGIDTVGRDLGGERIDDGGVAAGVEEAAGPGVEHRLEPLGGRAHGVEGDQLHGEVVAQALSGARVVPDLTVEGGDEGGARYRPQPVRGGEGLGRRAHGGDRTTSSQLEVKGLLGPATGRRRPVPPADSGHSGRLLRHASTLPRWRTPGGRAGSPPIANRTGHRRSRSCPVRSATASSCRGRRPSATGGSWRRRCAGRRTRPPATAWTGGGSSRPPAAWR